MRTSFFEKSAIIDFHCDLLAPDTTTKFIDAIQRSARRWGHVSVSPLLNGSINGIIFDFLVQPHLSLPRLESAKIYLKEDSNYTDPQFLSDAPMLRHLDITWSSPLFTGLPPSLVKMELEITLLITETPAFLAAFAALVNLEELSLDLAHTERAHTVVGTDIGIRPVSLGRLKNL